MDKKIVAQEVVKHFINIGALSFRFDPPYTYTSGLKSPVYLDNRLVMSNPEVRRQFIDYYVDLIKSEIGIEHIDAISGTATAAISMTAWLADRFDLPMVYVRSGNKKHGKENQVEGVINPKSRVLVVEDHISTGKSLIENVDAIRKSGGIVEYGIATSTYDTKIANDALKAKHVNIFTLVKAKDIVEAAFNLGKINKKQKTLVEDWFKDPGSWAQRNGL